jgi:hypothetical protein
MSRVFSPSQAAAVVAALTALLDEWSDWEGTARELHGRLSNFIEEVPPVRALERMLAAITPELCRQGIDVCRIDSQRHRTWAIQLLFDPWSDSRAGSSGISPEPQSHQRVARLSF